MVLGTQQGLMKIIPEARDGVNASFCCAVHLPHPAFSQAWKQGVKIGLLHQDRSK